MVITIVFSRTLKTGINGGKNGRKMSRGHLHRFNAEWSQLRRRRQRASIDLLHSRFIPRKGLKECEDSFSATLSSAMPWSDRNVTSLFLGWRVELETD